MLGVLRLHKTISQLGIGPNAVLNMVKIQVPILDQNDDTPAPSRRRIVGKHSPKDLATIRFGRGTPLPTPTASQASEDESDVESEMS